MASKKTATKYPKIPKDQYCKDYGHQFTDYGISQPANGDHIEVCRRCHTPRVTPNPTKPKKAKPVYVPPRLRGEAATLFDLAAYPMTPEGTERARRKEQLAKNRAQQKEINERMEAQHPHE